jgi:DNA-binding MarR family transcriptional regulator
MAVMAPQEAATRGRTVTWLNLQQASRVLQARLEGLLEAEAGLSWPEFELLFRLHIAGGRPLQMAEIADQLLASPSGITRLADRLLAKGLIGRHVPDDNRRVVRITLTEAGRTRLESADRTFHHFLEHSFAEALTGEEVEVLRSVLRKLLEHSGAWASDRCDPAPRALSS